jgi:flavin reductase (DIM6/NTAB) family NADH-FMN oxidoreductase RutF
MKIEPEKFYKAFAPRLAVLVTTIDSMNRVNAAPFSFAMPVSMNPPMLAFGMSPKNNTIANISETKEFVVNVPTVEILKQVWECGESLARGVSEMEKTGLSEVKAAFVKPPRVAECIAWFECTLEWMKEAGDHVLVVGRVIGADVKREYIKKDGSFDVSGARLILHVGGKEFCLPGKSATL